MPENIPSDKLLAPAAPPQQTQKRPRGGQPGNTNALRHGAYAHDLDRLPLQQLREIEMRGIFTQAARLKDLMQKIYTENIDSTDPAVMLSSLRALSLAGASLSHYVQRYARLRQAAPSAGSLADLLSSLDAAVEHTHGIDE